MKISLAMIVRDEEIHINRCIDSVKSIVDEIVIVDTGSTDSTLNILNMYSDIKLFHFKWCDDFSSARNYSIEQATGDYILVLDADEYVKVGSRKELEEIMQKNAIGRIQHISRFKIGNEEYNSKMYISRFFPKELRYTGIIHEQICGNNLRMNLNFIVKHDGYFETNKARRNIPLLRKELTKDPNDSYYLFQLGQELRIDKQYEEAYCFLKRSYERTKTTSSFYKKLVVELINCGKECGKEEVLEVINENETKLKNVTDFHFAKGLYYLDFCLTFPGKSSTYLKKIEESFLICFGLSKEKHHLEYLNGTSTFLAAYNLGVYYEVIGNEKKALEYYSISSNFGYKPAKKRLKAFYK